MVKLLARARMTVSGTPGTATTVNLGSAVARHQTFAAAGATNSDVLPVYFEDGDDWEMSTVTYSTSGPSLTNRTLGESSTGSLLDLSSDAEVFISARPADIQIPPSEGAFANGDKAKLDGIAAGAQINTVNSVNAQTGAVVLDADDIDDAATTHKFATAAQLSKLDGVETGATADQTGAEIKALYEAETNTNAYTDAEKAKVGHISITQAVDLDAIEARVNELDASVVLKGTWDASLGSFPVSTKSGESWIVTVSGAVDGVSFVVNDRIIAITDGASTTVYASNWHKADYTDSVLSVAGKTGAITLAKADITDFDDGDYATATQGGKADTALQPAAVGTTVQAYDADILKADEHKTLVAGIDATAENLGTWSSGSLTPEVDGATKNNLKRLTANGAFSVLKPSSSGDCPIIILITNGASAGAIDFSDYDTVNGDPYETTNGAKFLAHILKIGTTTKVTLEAL